MGIRNLLKAFSKKSTSSARRRKISRNLGVENLENRELMASNVFFQDGVLNINMTGNETVSIGTHNGRVRDFSDAHSPLNGRLNVPADQVLQIRVNGSDGNDQIHLEHVNNENFPKLGHTEIKGNGGRDAIFGSQVVDYIYGGRGNDVIFGNGGNDRIYGQRGNDTISGNAGEDWLYGGAGDDWLYGMNRYRGNRDYAYDRIHGGKGKDIAFMPTHDHYDYVHSAKRVFRW